MMETQAEFREDCWEIQDSFAEAQRLLTNLMHKYRDNEREFTLASRLSSSLHNLRMPLYDIIQERY